MADSNSNFMIRFSLQLNSRTVAKLANVNTNSPTDLLRDDILFQNTDLVRDIISISDSTFCVQIDMIKYKINVNPPPPLKKE